MGTVLIVPMIDANAGECRSGDFSPLVFGAQLQSRPCGFERESIGPPPAGELIGMPIVNRVADLQSEIAAWRQDIHAHPEILYEVHRTAGLVAERLREFGCDEVITGIGRTGVVGVIRGRAASDGQAVKTVGLRADMDALPIEEKSDLSYRSLTSGAMHACGHDGHTAMLLGAARYLCETRNFAGNAVVIFQPAEEGGAGAAAMIEDGLMDRFGIGQVYGMHNMPGVPVGEFAIRTGPFMAAGSRLNIHIEGIGGHAANPQLTIDPIVVGGQLIVALQSIVARSVDPLEAAVLSLCQFHAGHANNVIPQSAMLGGTMRTLTPAVRDRMEQRLKEIIDGVARLTDARIDLDYRRGYPALVNPAEQAGIAAEVAASVVGSGKVNTDPPPIMASEDFSYMMQARPGAFIFIGNGASKGLHHESYNFNDDAIVYGTSFWIKLVETTLAA
jgi:hippurate hydrolase